MFTPSQPSSSNGKRAVVVTSWTSDPRTTNPTHRKFECPTHWTSEYCLAYALLEGDDMFERYTEKARRVVFFARYEASQYGSPFIETEHLLLGLLREDKQLANKYLKTARESADSIRQEIESKITKRPRTSTSVEVPLSQECKRILANAATEAEALNQKNVGTEHVLLGMLREEKCFAAELLLKRGIRHAAIREELTKAGGATPVPVNQGGRGRETSLLAEFSRDLTAAAQQGQLDPLVGREPELERLI